ncbi:MAG: DNA repair protein RecN [Bacteroidales bacterium]
MIISLNIRNYALIDALNIDLEKGFSVLTGETGAGKSIILGALSLILGQRADARAVKDGETKCVIEGTFDLSNYKLESFFQENDLEYDAQHCIIRREVYATGKSRAFINDTPVSLMQLKTLGSSLIDIHSQHQNLLLGDDVFQLKVIDTLAGNEEVLTAYRSEYSQYKQLNTELRVLTEKALRNKEEADYLRFQFEQLQEADLKEGELTELEQELETLTHAEDIKATLFAIGQLLDRMDGGILQDLKDASGRANTLRSLYPKVEEIAERLQSDYIDLKDLVKEVEYLQDSISFDPVRQNWIQERLDVIYRLQQKHHVSTDAGLIAFRDQIAERLDGIDSSDERIADIKKQIEIQRKRLEDVAHLLSEKRKQAALAFASNLAEGVKPLGMPNVRFEVSFQAKTNYDESGVDMIRFMFSANKNQSLMPVAEIASGGEISRLMLVIKSLIASATALPTIVFDEIDTGVSGEIADKMGEIMQAMSRYMQVMTISHLPQVAGKGASHYKVYKKDTEHSTITHIVRLSDSERVEEIARMLSGSVMTEQAMENARVLLRQKEKNK